MLQDAKLSYNLWAEAVSTANYIRNRSPVHGVHKTPTEIFFGRKPDISGMKTFGATAFVHVPKSQRQKLDAVSKKGVFVGYAADSKAYRVLMDDTHKIVISRDVTFDETAPKVEMMTNTESHQVNDLNEEAEDALDDEFQDAQGEDDNTSQDGESIAEAPGNEAAEPEGAAN